MVIGHSSLVVGHAPLSEEPSAAAALRAARARLAKIDYANVTASALLAHVLGLTRAQLLAHLQAPLAAEQAAAFDGLLARAALGEPLAYLIGHREFYGLDFVVDARVLVPRPETEMLVDLTLAARPRRVLDVGTGSGCIAVALAARMPEAIIAGTDLSPGALELARHNAQRHGVEQRIQFIQSDLLAFFRSPNSAISPSKIVRLPTSDFHSPFDLICANLPYIDHDALRGLPVARFEPQLALDGGPGGLVLIERLLAQASGALESGGLLLLEIGADQGPRAMALAQAAFTDAEVRVERDLAGLDRVLVVGPG